MGDRRTLLRYGFQVGLTGLAAACSPLESARSLFETDDREHITVLADSSLGPTTPALKDDFERANPHVALTFSLSSSGSIMKSILRGKRFDALLLTGDTFAIPLVEAGHIKIGSMRPITSNWLVLATPQSSSLEIQSAQDLLRDEVSRIGVADWEQSALGIYSRQALESLDLWESLGRKRAKSKDERELADRLIDNKVDAALLYSSSSVTSEERIKVQAPVPEQSHRPIIYYVGTAQETKYPITLSQFTKYLISQWGQRHFEAAGYRLLNLR